MEREWPCGKLILVTFAAFGGTISSYTWICMIISFLQRRDPPIVPSLQKAEGKRVSCERTEPSRFADDLEALKGFGDSNEESQAQLLFQFFRHYGYEFDYSKYVVSVKEGRLLSREEKKWQPSNYHDKEAQKRLCVEEPFTTTRNLGNTADDYSWSGVHTEIRRAFELLADGQQLEKCCEQYEFPPEENRLVFQRPPPKPAVTLRRSASQSGRPNHEQGSGGRQGRKANQRNQSAQRAGNRRASSGASFGNQRTPMMPLQSPPIGVALNDYFGKSTVHEYLSHQYQMLQQQRDALTAQLQQQQQQVQGQRVGDLTGSPLHRGGSGFHQNGLPSPRFLDYPPQTAPLLPGSLYHYSSRYPPGSPMSQARSRDGGTNTNPSSPSLMAAVPAQLRRQVHRTSITDGTSSSSARSQSQPGRSIPHLLALQQQPHPGYDVSGAIPAGYQSLRATSGQMYGQAAATAAGLGMQYPVPPLPTLHSLNGGAGAADHGTAIPKEYMGYAISPQFGPQQYATQHSQPMQQVPPMTLRDPPQRQRRVTPDLQPPMPNGKHASRSPSPLGHLRSYSTIADLRSRSQAQTTLHSPMSYDEWRARNQVGVNTVLSPTGAAQVVSPTGAQVPTVLSPTNAQVPTLQSPDRYEMPVPVASMPSIEREIGGPLIVNGSTPVVLPKAAESSSNGTRASKRAEEPNGTLSHEPELTRMRSLPLRMNNMDRYGATERIDTGERATSPQRISSSVRPKQSPRLNLSPNGASPNGLHEAFHDPSPLTAPLLSPVAELRTPSPTHSFDRMESPRTNGLFKATHIANASKQAEQRGENGAPPMSLRDRSLHERQGSAANSGKLPAKSPTTSGVTPTSGSGNPNPWQQVQTGKKGHKKSKSTSAPSARGAGGQAVPVNESERKGG